MPFTIYAEDNEFAVSTDGNVDYYEPGKSKFDYPPNSTKDLTITSHVGDTDERLFEVGETYSVTFGGNGGTTIANAVITRSDYITADDGTPVAGNEGAIVFEGLDSDGEIAQVVWTPNFDLETWYFDNFSGGNSPGFWSGDQNASEEVRYACFVAGSMIDVPGGQKPVDWLRPGDTVMTLDNGPAELRWVARSEVPGLGLGTPITIAPEVFGGTAPLIVSPQHRLLVRHPTLDIMFSEPEMLVPARFLVDGVKITRASRRTVSYCHLLFDRHEIVRSGGIWSESLFLGDQMASVISDKGLGELDRLMAEAGLMKMARPELQRFEAPIARQLLGLAPKDCSRPVPRMLFAA